MQRNLLIATVLIALSPVLLWAQPACDTQPPHCHQGNVRGPGQGGPGPEMGLNLTQEQRDKLNALREEFKPKFQEAFKAGDKEKVAAVRSEFLGKAKEFLSEEQVAKMEKFGQAMHKRMKDRCGDKGSKLNLTDDQKAKLKDLRTKHKADAKALRQKYKTDVQALLTPEQAKIWSEMKTEKKHHRKGWGQQDWRSKKGAVRGKGMGGFGMGRQPMGPMGFAGPMGQGQMACPTGPKGPMGAMGAMGSCPPMMGGQMGAGPMGPMPFQGCAYIIIVPMGQNPWNGGGCMMNQGQPGFGRDGHHFRGGQKGFDKKAHHNKRGKGHHDKKIGCGTGCGGTCPTAAPAAATETPAAPAEEKE